MQFEITSGKVTGKGMKVTIYGAEGIGKSSLAAQFPHAVFIDTEGSTDNMNVQRLPKPTSWQMLKDEVTFIQNHSTQCSTLVIDTFDWAEQLCIDAICQQHNKKGIEDFGYGNGYVYEREEIARFLTQLENLTLQGINVVILCHAQTRKYELPEEMGQYDRWELKLGKKTASQISPLVKEWADMVLFLNYKTHVYTVDDKGKKHKAAGRERVMYTTHHACWDAKNRCGLPEELPLAWESIAHVIPDNFSHQPPAQQMITQAQAQGIPVQPEESIEDFELISGGESPAYERVQGIAEPLADLMEENHIKAEHITYVSSVIWAYFPNDMALQDYPQDYQEWLVANWNAVFYAVRENCKDYIPF